MDFSCENNAYSALPAGYKCLRGIGHVIHILLIKSLQSGNRITRAFPKNYNDFLHLLDLTIVAATTAFLLPVQD